MDSMLIRLEDNGSLTTYSVMRFIKARYGLFFCQISNL